MRKRGRGCYTLSSTCTEQNKAYPQEVCSLAEFGVVAQELSDVHEFEVELELVLDEGCDEDHPVLVDGLGEDGVDADLEEAGLLGEVGELGGEGLHLPFYGVPVVHFQVAAQHTVEVCVLLLILHRQFKTILLRANILKLDIDLDNPSFAILVYCYITALIQMGQQSTGMGRIHQLSESLTLVRTQPGEKIYLNRQTEEEYLLITRLAQPQDDFENTLAKRRELKCCYLPQLIDYGKQTQGYCSDTSVVNILFRHPAKSLAEEQIHRTSVGECFEEGELLMVSYCTLQALIEYSKMGDNYELSINEQTLLIEMDGKIILSDAGRYKDQSSRRQSLRRICSEQGKIMSRIAMMQLGVVLFRMVQEGTKAVYSESLREYIELLKRGQFICYYEALTHLDSIKHLQRSSSTKLPKSRASLNSTPNPSANQTPIVQLMHLVQTRSPLHEIYDNPNQSQGIKSFCYNANKKKENKYQIYKSKFQARKTEAFAEQCLDLATMQQESTSIRLDQMSSIQQRLRQTEQDQPQAIDNNNNILPSELACYESFTPSNHIQPLARIELFSSNRPERLKQLVLNQKGIIFEESADQISSLASQRTHRIRHFSNGND